LPGGANTSTRTPLHVEADVLSSAAVASARAEWEALGAEVGASPYLTWGWLESWMHVYHPRRLLCLRLTDGDGGLVGLGLIEQCRLGVLRFAGAPITPVRGLLVAPEHERQAWRATTHWLRQRRDWTLLEGVAAGPSEPPGALLTPVHWFQLRLPATFEEFLAARPAGRRREFRRRLRVAEREGAITLGAMGANARSGIEAFARLHAARAQTKGERHRVIDARLVRMLEEVAVRGAPELRVFVVEHGGMTIGAAVQLDNRHETWAYNTGFDPAAAHLSPGIVVRLATVRDSIERGVERLDLGPGDFAYKRDFGGEPYTRLKVDVTSTSFAGRMMRERLRSEHRLRNAPLLRSGVMRWRALRRARYERVGNAHGR
jgi:CelD/BcsL family acetyltransferase involved in cellulose biosynthesis